VGSAGSAPPADRFEGLTLCGRCVNGIAAPTLDEDPTVRGRRGAFDQHVHPLDHRTRVSPICPTSLIDGCFAAVN
jgi:hypothetical protein